MRGKDLLCSVRHAHGQIIARHARGTGFDAGPIGFAQHAAVGRAEGDFVPRIAGTWFQYAGRVDAQFAIDEDSQVMAVKFHTVQVEIVGRVHFVLQLAVVK